MKPYHLALLTSAVVAFGGALWAPDALQVWQALPRDWSSLTGDSVAGLGAGLITLSALLGLPQRRRRRSEPDPWEW